MDEALAKEVFADEEFVKSLFLLDTPQEVQAALSGKGVELTVEEIVKMKELIVKKLDTGLELTDEELEMVSGGVVFEALAILAIAGLGITAGGILGTGITLAVTKAW
jgi:lactobin A/cerein 7B family class IIb bacteriocin